MISWKDTLTMLADADDTVLTEAEILELLNATTPNPVYRVYYDPATGEILSITNEVNKNFDTFIEVKHRQVMDFLTGRKNYSSYRVVYTTPNESRIVKKDTETYDFKSIKTIGTTDDYAESIVIENNLKLKRWIFKLRDEDKNIIKDFRIHAMLEFYITIADNPNYLIRTIKIKSTELAYNDKVYFDHISKFESQPGKIKITTRGFFKSYGLTTNDTAI